MGGLIINIERFFDENNYKGLLFCKQNLIGFYCKYNWELIPQERVKLPNNYSSVFTMVYNCPQVESIEYSDRMF